MSLTEENECLKAEVVWLKELMLSHEAHLPVEWKLSPLQAKVMGVLLRGNSVTVNRLVEIIYAHSDEPDTAYQVIVLMITRIRRKLAPFGIKINSDRLYGYTLNPPAKAIILHELRREIRITKLHCKHGHSLYGDNVYRKQNAGLGCKECRKIINLTYRAKVRQREAA
jgi:hypothetical protein